MDNIWIPHQVNLEFGKPVGWVEADNKYVKILERLDSQQIKWGKVLKMIERWESNGFEEAFKLKVLEMETSGVTPDKLLELKQIADRLHHEHRLVVPIDTIFEELFSNIGESFLDTEEQLIKKEFEATPLAPGYG
ncbi:hypothetical protein [Paenibacillus sp. NRS-1760]|uniref:hypothetical protein n=1 Tax=Paenibacillus sp. NRS-1760 TaxID=3233902 RepID=UPI003D2742A5